MFKQFIDLSATIDSNSEMKRKPAIKYSDHHDTVKNLAKTYGMEPEDFPEGIYCAIEELTLTTHEGTHLDAPWHYYPTSEGKPAKTIDEIPLNWCFSDGVVLDFSYKKPGEDINSDEVQEKLKEINYQLKPFDIVLIRTDAYKYYGRQDYLDLNPGVTREATLWLINQGIKVMGIDAWGWDRPHSIMVDEVKKGIKNRFWESHLVGKEREYCHLERLANLDKIPKPFGFKVSVFPIKIQNASGGWVRAVAMLE